jgi:AraC-like DNA-binding protein
LKAALLLATVFALGQTWAKQPSLLEGQPLGDLGKPEPTPLNILPYFNFSAAMLGIIALLDLLIRFKRPLLLKFYFISFVALMVGVNVFIFLGLTSPAILVILNIFRSFSVVFLILIMNSLYISAKKNWVYLSVALISGIAVYMSVDLFLHYDTLGVSVNLPPNDAQIFLFLNNSLRYLMPYRIITLLLVLFTTGRLTFLILKNSSTANIYFKQIIQWTYPLLSIGILQLVLFLISLIFKIDSRILNGVVIAITIYSFLIILYRPVFLNSHSLRIKLGEVFSKKQVLRLTESNFITPFFKKQYYLEQTATLEDYAAKCNIQSVEDLQNLIIKEFKISFSNLVNQQRVFYIIALLDNPKYRNYSIDALAQEAGFSSRSHLYKPFKKFHGGTPSDYISTITK